jgi:5-methylcytosine-specific restriction endonuclease McrA
MKFTVPRGWKQAQLSRQHGQCFYCPCQLELRHVGSVSAAAPRESLLEIRGATIDHVVPRSAGGQDDASNYVLACAPCNLKKGAELPTLEDIVLFVDLHSVRASHRPNGVGPIARHLLGLARKADAKLGIARKR